MLEFRILGPLEVVGDAGPLALGGPKQRATLAILLLNANRVVSIDRIADQLYAGRSPVTAATQVHRQISELRRVLGPDARLETRSPGYVIRVAAEQLDLKRFERLTEEAGRALARDEAETAFELQRDALALWRGPVLGDLDQEPFAQIAIGRLEEILLAALELRVDAELALGRHRELVGELEELSSQHPFHEPFAARLMLALYRSGRQADALGVYRRTRERLIGGFGIEPSRELRELERAILNQDASLDVGSGVAATRPVTGPDRIVLVLPSGDERLDVLFAVAEPLAALPGRALLIARLLPDETSLPSAAAALSARRASLGVEARTAAFTTVDPVADALRLTATYDVQLVLLDTPSLDAAVLPDDVASIVEGSPADVGLLTGPRVDWGSGDGVCVPFTGNEHDWAALELGASLASGNGTPLRLVGSRADVPRGRRDASRLLADASMAVQRAVGVDAVPQLVDPDSAALVGAAERATIVVTGLPANWRREGLGDARRALVRRCRATLLVHCGPRPSGLAPTGSRSRFTWTIESGPSP
ncbi:MAG: AfsR/SARP family transcriptional regulator [Actinobacteria bacterium]|nr:AfsR/SARP family transcriptional regulator [Actinomycetota bacterium]